MLSLVVAIIGLIGAIGGPILTFYLSKPRAPHASPQSAGGGQVVVAPGPVSRSYRWAIGACFAWLIPFTGYIVIAIGLCYAVRDSRRGMSRTTVTIVICVVCLVLTVINSAIGAYQGAHGTLFTPYG